MHGLKNEHGHPWLKWTVIFKHTKKAEALRYMMWSHVLSSSHNCQEAGKGKMPKYQPFWNDVLFLPIFIIQLYSKNLQWTRNLFPQKRFGRGQLNSVSWNTGWGTEAFGLRVSSFWDSSSPWWYHYKRKNLNYALEASSHDVNLLSLGEVEDFFGSGADHLVVLANRQERLYRR